jgi:two-component system NtrC family sensor kinase
MAAWRAARLELERDERHLEARTRELAVLQDLGRTAAEARTPASLFRRAAKVLQRGAGADTVVVVHADETGPRADVFVARPMAREHLDAIVGRACEAAGFPEGTTPRVEVDLLESFDESQGSRSSLHADDLSVLPIARRGSTVASLAVLIPERDEARLRVVYGAVNQLSLHLDRIMTVREAEQDRFRAILESMSQAVLLMNPDLRVVQANPAALRMLQQIGGGEPPSMLARVGNLDIAALAEGLGRDGATSTDGEARLGDGTILTVTLSAVAGDDGRPEGLVLVLADVTERRRLQEQLAQSEKLSSLGQMISGIAHELNNPLASVLGYAQLVRTATADEAMSRRVAVIHDEARRCQRIVKNLLSFARRHEPERKPLSLNEVAGSVVRLIGYQVRVDNIAVVEEFDPDVPAIYGDSHQLQQAILNLVTNAHHAIRDSQKAGTITLSTRRSPDGVILTVADDGPGIPEDRLSKIYDPFFTTKAAGKGTGLGLSIVYGIIAAHGGDLSVESRAGQGSRFTVELPLGTGIPAEQEPAPARQAVGAARRGNILVLDDEPSVAQLILETLVAEGHSVVAAHDVADALERAGGERFDVVVADLKMPGMMAETFRDDLEQCSPGLGSRILWVTGDTVSQEPEELARRLGAGVLHKPFDLDDLREAVLSRF